MNVLLTGAFGNIGTSALAELVKQGHTVRCFDIKTRANEKRAQRLIQTLDRTFGSQIEMVWGDLRRPEEIAVAVREQEVVVHLAFIIPKMSVTGVESEDRPDWAREINVGGTRSLLAVMKALPRPPKIVFISSYHVYGRTQDQPPPRTILDPVHPVEHYSHHKVECERMVQSSGFEWAILRLSAAMPFAIKLDPGMFDVPLDNRIEFVHSRDVGLAIANTVGREDVWGRLLLIGGGPRCQYYYREIVQRILDAMGVGMLPEKAFSSTPFCTDWVDTTISQRILNYQRHDLEDYIQEMTALLGYRRHLIRIFRSWVRRWLLNKSPYYQRSKSSTLESLQETCQEGAIPQGAMELTPEVRSLLIETAQELKGRAQRLFMAKAVKALGKDGEKKAEQELGWPRKAIRVGIYELEKGTT